MTLSEWRYARDAWRMTASFDERSLDLFFRARSATILPASAQIRLAALGIPGEVVMDTLSSIRSVRQWPTRWIETAQRFLGEFRRQTSAGDPYDAASARQTAALCYHAAQLLDLHDERAIRQCRAAAASLFTMSLPAMHPHTRHIWIPWRDTSLPAYLRIPPDPIDEPVGLVVFLNEFGMAKEETISYAQRFIDAGCAFLALDTPGSGEATSTTARLDDQDDLLDGVIDSLRGERLLDLSRLAIAGGGLGGYQAIRIAAQDRRVSACIVVTPPYDPTRWIHRASPLLVRMVSQPVHHPDAVDPEEIAQRLSLVNVTPKVTQPTLVFGGGQDVLVPPTEAQHVASGVGERASLVWYPSAGHLLHRCPDQWTHDAAAWLGGIDSTQGESAELRANAGRDALTHADYEPVRQTTGRPVEENEFEEYARVLPRDPASPD